MISEGYKENFKTLLRAAKNKHLALLECTDAVTGKTVMAIVAMNHTEDGQYETVPLAKLFDGNPYQELVPPTLPGVVA